MAQTVASIMCIVYFVKGVQETWRYFHYTVPQQFLELVRQAHMGEEFKTIWNIQVSDAMRLALCNPLTPEQIDALAQLKDERISRSIDGYLVSYHRKAKSLIGIVTVSIDIASALGTYHYQYSGVKLQITVSRAEKEQGGKWAVTSVKQL